MTNPYGPWATAIDAGRNPQLHARCWRRRLTMLVPASRTSPALSRRHLLGLFAAAALICALPTLHAAPAAAQQQKPAAALPPNVSGGSPAADMKNSDGTPAYPSEAATTTGRPLLPEDSSFTTSIPPFGTSDVSSPFYQPLFDERTHAELHLSGEQEQKLRAVAQQVCSGGQSELSKARPGIRKGESQLVAGGNGREDVRNVCRDPPRRRPLVPNKS